MNNINNNAKKWIIHRLEDEPDFEKGSDDGPFWDKYNARSTYRRFYVNFLAASMIAFWFNENSNVVLTVTEVPQEEVVA